MAMTEARTAADQYAARVDAVLAQRTRLRGPQPPGDLFAGGNYPGRLRSPVQSALLHFGRREKRVPLKDTPDGLKDIFGMLTSGGKIPGNATELLGPLQRAKPA